MSTLSHLLIDAILAIAISHILTLLSRLHLSGNKRYHVSSVQTLTADAPTPIRVAHKAKRRKSIQNVFIDDRGYPDPSNEYDILLHNVDGGTVLRKLSHPVPALDGSIDPSFNFPFIPEKHEAEMRQNLDLSHLPVDLQEKVYGLIREFWPVFDTNGVFVPVKSYECVIDTGNARPIAVKKILYGERETVIMRDCIAALAKMGLIRQITEGGWLFKALLAPKPHQENVTDIKDFQWRFCVNYIPLNMVTRVTAYPIPRCDTAVFVEFGSSVLLFLWMWDAPQGYHQLAVAKSSQEKLAFQGVDTIKWTYNVMPFGPTNGPATFINFIHDLDSVWKELAKKNGVSIDTNTNTRIIVDDIVSWSDMQDTALKYMRAQLQTCQAYRLSLKLNKSRIFPNRMEFVGVDVCADGNRPAQSKHVLLKSWPIPEIVRDVAKFVGFAQFYSRWIQNFELRIMPLRAILTQEYSDSIGDLWTQEAQASFDDIRNSILSDPVIKRFNHNKLCVLRSDFSSLGFGYVLLQPGSDSESIKAMDDYRAGKGFTFMTPGSLGMLHPICFGARRTRGNESRLHSHLGEGFAGDYAINKCRQYLFAQRFVWVTDCYAIKFILSYEGGNSAILRLQMRLMCWDCDIVHRPESQLVDADYWSRLGVDLEYDPLFLEYLQKTCQLRKLNPPTTSLPMLPENMPYYRGPRITTPNLARSSSQESDAEAHHINTLITNVASHDTQAYTHLSNVPVRFGKLSTPTASQDHHQHKLYNSEIASYALNAISFSWAVYAFSNGHFPSTILSRNLPFRITLACDVTASGRSLFGEFAPDATVFSSGNDLLHHIRSSGDRSIVHGYLINTVRFRTSDITSRFWKLQYAIITQLRLIRALNIVVAIVIKDHDGEQVIQFRKELELNHWKVSTQQVSYNNIGDTVADHCVIIIAIHKSCENNSDSLILVTPPVIPPKPISAFLYTPFNRPDHSVSLGRNDNEFNKDESCIMTVTTPKDDLLNPATTPTVKVSYFLHRPHTDISVVAGASVLSVDGLCPPFDASPNSNIFQHLFGIEFKHDDKIYVRPISLHEFASCFQLTENIQYRLSHETYKYGLDASMPGKTSAWLFDQIYDRLEQIRDSNIEIFSPDQYAAPAAPIQVLVNGTICTMLPSHERWVQAYNNDSEMCALKKFVLNPSLISNKSLADVNHNYRAALRQSLITIENDLLIYKEPIDGSSSYTRLQIVPTELRNVIFVAFHTNPIGGHLNAYRTMHRVRLRFYWPGMFSYIKKMCSACPGCALSNPSPSISSELVYNFPVDAPFNVMHFDAYSAGKSSSFEGFECYLLGCCGMTAFACMEPITHATATTFAAAIMKILLRHGLCFTAVLDKDSKFFGVCREALDLLHINCHVLSSGNHNPMLVERVNRYLNKGLKIMCNERESIRIAPEAILLLLYAWNSCPVAGTDLSRSFVAMGRIFQFPIDFSDRKHHQLTSTPDSVTSYSKNLAMNLKASREVATLLLQEQRSRHREYINSRRPDPKVYNIDDVVFARREVRSNAKKGIVDKLQMAYTGPWRITAKLQGASYEIEFVNNPSRKDKKHASDLSPYPIELIPFQQLDGPDNRYGQLYKTITPHAFKEAGLVGIMPVNPYKASANFSTTDRCQEFHWLSLAELNEELDSSTWVNDEDYKRYIAGDCIDIHPVFATGPPPEPPSVSIPTIPSVESITAAIVNSSDKLFFISVPIGDNDVREWRLVSLAFKQSVALYPSCMQDGRFLFEFYICHPDDWRYNSINQRYWLQYHHSDDITAPTEASETHLVRPSPSSTDFATANNLQPFRKWYNITHYDTYIHGPFNFATHHGRKTRDRISQEDWDILKKYSSKFQNSIPSSDVPTYSIHVDRGAHTSFHDNNLCNVLISEATQSNSRPGGD